MSKQGLDIPKYELIERTGSDHEPLFKVKVTGILFNSPPYWVHTEIASGKSKKIAEIKAAEQLCRKIGLDYIPSEI